MGLEYGSPLCRSVVGHGWCLCSRAIEHGWCVGPTIAIVFLQQSSPPSLTWQKVKFFIILFCFFNLLGLAWVFVS
jgi:hypothetical protein